MDTIASHRDRIAAALGGALAADGEGDAPGLAAAMVGVAESLAAIGSFDVDDLRQRGLTDIPPAGAAALLVLVLPYGLAFPLERPRLRRDAYRHAATTGADEGTAVACVGAALLAADLLRFEPAMAAIRVRQSLLEDAPMALLNRITILERDDRGEVAEEDPGAVLQLALSALAWSEGGGVEAALSTLGDDRRRVAGTLAAALTGACVGRCDVPIEAAQIERVERVATALCGLTAGATT